MDRTSFALTDPFLKVLIPTMATGIVFLVIRFKHISKQQLLFNPPKWSRALSWFVLYIAFMLGSDFLLNWRGAFDFTPWSNQATTVIFARVLAVVVLGPIAEELVFRGLFTLRLSKITNSQWAAMVIVAVGWGLLHFEYDFTTRLLIVCNGLILGAAMLKTRSIYVPIAMHIAWNLYAIW